MSGGLRVRGAREDRGESHQGGEGVWLDRGQIQTTGIQGCTDMGAGPEARE